MGCQPEVCVLALEGGQTIIIYMIGGVTCAILVRVQSLAPEGGSVESDHTRPHQREPLVLKNTCGRAAESA